jgi:hypothetical protein
VTDLLIGETFGVFAGLVGLRKWRLGPDKRIPIQLQHGYRSARPFLLPLFTNVLEEEKFSDLRQKPSEKSRMGLRWQP